MSNLPKRDAYHESPPTKVYYREGTEVYATVYASPRPYSGRREFVCRCDTVSWANYVINCLTMPEMMQENEDE